MLAPIAVVALTSLVLSPAARPGAARPSARHPAATMKILRWQEGASVEATKKALEGLIESSRSTEGVFVLQFTEPSVLSNFVFERTIETYESSQLFDGPALACAQIMRIGDGGAQDQICEALSVDVFPTTQVWRRGELVQETSAYELEALLLSLGLRSAENRANMGTEGGAGGPLSTADDAKQRGIGSGLPDANAVDEIDFTGGGGYGGRPDQKKQLYGGWKDRGTTADYFPLDPDEKAGDQMGDAGQGKR